MTGPATRTVTHPGPDGTLWHYPLPRIVGLSAALRRSGYTCTVAVSDLGALSVSWAGEGVKGSLRLWSVEPTVAGTHGTIVDHLPVAGLATRPLPKRPVSEVTRAVSLPGLRKALSLAHGEGWRTPVLSADEWAAREAEAARVLGADLERVQAA